MPKTNYETHLFLFYINDIITIHAEVKFIIYVDDTAMIISGTNSETVITKPMFCAS